MFNAQVELIVKILKNNKVFTDHEITEDLTVWNTKHEEQLQRTWMDLHKFQYEYINSLCIYTCSPQGENDGYRIFEAHEIAKSSDILT